MQIPQVNQHQHVPSGTDSKQPGKETNLLSSFEGQLINAEQVTDLFSNERMSLENRKEYEKAVSDKRKSDDHEKDIDVKYWSELQLTDQVKEDLTAKSFGMGLKTQEMENISNANQLSFHKAADQKALNQEVGRENILSKKPHLLNPIVDQKNQSLNDGPSFSEMLQSKSEQQVKTNQATVDFSALQQVAKEGDPIIASSVHAGQNTKPMQNQLKTAIESPGLIKAKMEGGLSAKMEKPAQFGAERRTFEPLTAKLEKPAVLTKGAESEINVSAKEGQKSDTAGTIKETASNTQRQSTLQEVVDNIKVMLSSGKDSIVVRLTPEHLGKLEIKLKKANGVLSGEMKVETLEARDLLQSSFSDLQQDLDSQGIRLESFSVLVKGDNTSKIEVAANKNEKTNLAKKGGDSKNQPKETSSGSSTMHQKSGNDPDLNILV